MGGLIRRETHPGTAGIDGFDRFTEISKIKRRSHCSGAQRGEKVFSPR